MTRSAVSWNQGLVRGPEVSSRVSGYSPPRLNAAGEQHRKRLLLAHARDQRRLQLADGGLRRAQRDDEGADLLRAI